MIADGNSKTNRVVASRYELRGSLGQGGFGEVFLAYDRHLNTEVAVKQLFGSATAPALIKQRERESRIYSQLSSKHIIPIHDSFIYEGTYYLVFELMEHSLDQYTEPVELHKVIEWAKECLQGLQDIHVCGVIHRDIKPSNIFIDKRGSIRIGDFGAAQAGPSISLPAWTPKYIAPEVILGDQSKVGPSSDLYSLGLVIYQLILGEEGMKKAFREVYEGVDRTEAINNRWLLWQQNSDRKAPAIKEFIPEISEGLSDWVKKLVEKDPVERYQSAKEALEELYKITDNKLQAELVTSGVQTVKGQEKKEEERQKDTVKKNEKDKNQRLMKMVLYALGGIAGVAIILWIVLILIPRQKNEVTLPPTEKPKPTASLSKISFSINTEATVSIEAGAERTEKSGRYVEFELKPGEYLYTVAAKGYVSESGTFELTSLRNMDKEITLREIKQEPEKGQEKLKSPKEVTNNKTTFSKVSFSINTGAIVTISGGDRVDRKEGNHIEFELKPGEYQYAIAASGYVAQSGNFYLTSSRDIDKEITLTKNTESPQGSSNDSQHARSKNPRIIINSTNLWQTGTNVLVHINMDGWDVAGETLEVQACFFLDKGAYRNPASPRIVSLIIYPEISEQHWEDLTLDMDGLEWRSYAEHNLLGYHYWDKSLDMFYKVSIIRLLNGTRLINYLSETDYIPFQYRP